jgi:Fur family ferric uptake transcriptional regulator
MPHRKPNAPAKPEPARLDAVLDALRCRGLRVTGPRRAILGVLASGHGPFSADDVFAGLGGRGRCDLATVYRSLKAMEAHGIARRCEFGDGVQRFELAEADGGHHHHLICRVCRKVEPIGHCAALPLEAIARERNYREVTHILEIFGVCPECAAAGRG